MKIKKLCSICILYVICMCFLLTSCSKSNSLIDNEISFWDGVFKTEDYVCYSVLDKIVKSIETKDKELLLSLFSENTQVECHDLEAQAEALFYYCSGKMVSWGKYKGDPYSSTHMDGDGNYQKSLEPSYDINTSEGSYRITFRYMEVDTIDRGNEGLLSLYVIKAEDDTDINCLYGGDGKYTPGIHLGVTWSGGLDE